MKNVNILFLTSIVLTYNKRINEKLQEHYYKLFFELTLQSPYDNHLNTNGNYYISENN